MKNYLSILITVLLLATFSCQQNPQSGQAYDKAAKELQELNEQYCTYWMNGDMEACLSMMTPNYVNYLVNNTQNRVETEKMFHNIPGNMTTANAVFSAW